jgi:cellulose synthase operon protein C
VTAAATYYIAETYSDFGRSLTESERPTNLGAAELKEYEDALDEQAFPFEEKAIGVHEKNMEMLRAGVFNDWTKKSLEKLTELMPGRYAKPEMSIGFLTEIETYAYRSPSSQVAAPTGNADTSPGKPDQTTQPTPQPADKGMVKHGTAQ